MSHSHMNTPPFMFEHCCFLYDLINIDNNSLFSPVYFLNVVSPYTRCAIHFLFTHTVHAIHYYYVVDPSFKTNNKTKQQSVANYI